MWHVENWFWDVLVLVIGYVKVVVVIIVVIRVLHVTVSVRVDILFFMRFNGTGDAIYIRGAVCLNGHNVTSYVAEGEVVGECGLRIFFGGVVLVESIDMIKALCVDFGWVTVCSFDIG